MSRKLAGFQISPGRKRKNTLSLICSFKKQTHISTGTYTMFKYKIMEFLLQVRVLNYRYIK